MGELIKINTNDEGVNVVSARELHEGLKVNSRFNDWIKNRINKYEFTINDDYITLTKNLVNGGKETDYIITIDMAKELCMVENNEQGRKMRKYFIECEKKLKEITTPSYMIQDPIARAEAWIKEQKEHNKEIAELKPKADFYDDVAGSKDSIEMGHVAKVLNIKGYGRNKLFQFLREHKVLDRSNIPYQQYVDRGYFRVLEQKYTTSKGETKINIKTLVFQKGIDFIRKLIKDEEIVRYE